MKQPKILFYDLETNGVNALHADLGFIICFGYKWLGDKKAKCLTFADYGGYLKNGYTDKGLLKAARDIIEEADLLVAHYGDNFDRKFINGRLAINGLKPIPSTKQVDTCKLSWKYFNFQNNRLKFLAKTLKCKNQKAESKFPEWWLSIMAGDLKVLKLCADYCAQDVEVLEEVYLKMRSLDEAHIRLYSKPACKVCGGRMNNKGTLRTREKLYQRSTCTSCGRYDKTAILKETE